MLGKNVESLKNMSASTSKFAKWYVRIIDPKVNDYTFQARGEKVNAKKFECVVVSRGPSQYMMGMVPFELGTARLPTRRAQCSVLAVYGR